MLRVVLQGRARAGGSRFRILREAPWQIVLFSIGMYLVVYGLGNQGLTDEHAGVFSNIGNGVLVTALGVGVTVAVLASLTCPPSSSHPWPSAPAAP